MAISNPRISFFLAFLPYFMAGCVWSNSSDSSEYLPLDDSEYPYAGLPRMVIETDDFHELRDTETDIPARMQMYSKGNPESEVIELTVKGHGNSSFKAMTKFSLKIELAQKKEPFGHATRQGMGPHLQFFRQDPSKELRDFQARTKARREPCATLYIRRTLSQPTIPGSIPSIREHKGLQKKVNIPQNNSSFLFEKTTRYHLNGETIRTKKNTLFKIRYPKQPSSETTSKLQTQLDQWENYLYGKNFNSAKIDEWIDIIDYIRYFWLLEFSKNYDGRFGRSIFFT